MTGNRSGLRRLIAATLIALGGVAALASPALASSTAWSPVTSVAATSGMMAEPHTAVAANGTVVVTWNQIESGVNRVMASARVDGETWSTPTQISADSNALLAPTIAVDDHGVFVVTWIFNDGTTTSAQATTSSNGVDWSTPATLSEPNDFAGQASVGALPGGGFIAAWTSQLTGTTHIAVAHSTDGVNWTSVGDHAVINESVNVTFVTATTSGRVLVGFHSADNDDSYLNVLVSDDQTTWSLSPHIAVAAGGMRWATIVPTGTDGFAAIWTNWNGASGSVETATSADGLSWSTITSLSTPGVDASLSRIAGNPTGRLVAAWTENDGTNVTRFSAVSTNAGLSWSQPVVIETGVPRSNGLALAANPDGSFAAVFDNTLDGTVHTVEFAESPDGASWSAPEPLDGVPARGFAPQLVAIDGTRWLTHWNATVDGQTALVSLLRTVTPDPTPSASPASLAATGARPAALLALGGLLLGCAAALLLRRRAS